MKHPLFSLNSRNKALSIKSFDAPSTRLPKSYFVSTLAASHLCPFQLFVRDFLDADVQIGGKCVCKTRRGAAFFSPLFREKLSDVRNAVALRAGVAAVSM